VPARQRLILDPPVFVAASACSKSRQTRRLSLLLFAEFLDRVVDVLYDTAQKFPGYRARHVMPNVAEGAAKSRRAPLDIAVIVPVMTIVGDSDEERLLLRGTDDEGVYVLVVSDRFIHE
jgi:hypothetical protein